ncbi:cAMP-binding protein [Fulvitalea axinellae]|uniref:cAMP-binding protein n=1 Tax=Fulvitalea axinellae TaxID=1182444 RepID=A0AAU9DC92_9BACT|nr:cAMP-binding protein [Fulvitalea axinellae]
MVTLEEYIREYFGVAVVDLERASRHFRVQKLSKDDFFVKSGRFCNRLSFVSSGYLRVYAFADGRDVTQWVAKPGQLLTDLSSFVFESPARWNIQALTDCEIFTVSKADYGRFGDVVKDWERLEKMFIAKCFLTMEERVFSFLSMNAEERYQSLFRSDPDLFNRVSLRFLASMLGMAPETLSRLRRKSLS